MDEFRIDSYKFLPRSMWPIYQSFPPQPGAPTPARPAVALREARVALLTSGGLYLRDRQPSFDVERERREPTWGDPSYRIIPRQVRAEEMAVAHLHINPDDILADYNVALPLEVFARLEQSGEIGALAGNNYSFMGYQGASCDAWRERYGPALAGLLHEDRVNLLILAPT